MPWLEITIGAGLVGIVGLCIFLVRVDSRKRGEAGAVADVVVETREREARAEVHLDAPRPMGTGLVARLRRKLRGDPS